MSNDKELKNLFKVFIDKDKIFNIVFYAEKTGDDNTRLAELVKESVFKILDAAPEKKYKFIVDLKPMGNTGYFTEKSIKIYTEIAAAKQAIKIAIVGGSTFLRTTTIFILSMAGKGGYMKWFKTMEEARKWLLK